MVNQLLQPQEVEVFYILPTIRRYMAQAMKKQGLQQKEIAKVLYIKDSTVSQYINNKRASKINFEKDMVAEINKSTEIIHTKSDLIRETQRLLGLIRQQNVLCLVHKQLSDVPFDCNISDMKCA